MRIVWDAAKAARNKLDHDGVSFEEAASAIDDPSSVLIEDGAERGEQRFKLLGRSASGRILTVIYAYRDHPEAIRIISAWKANGPARKRYEQKRP